jgi:amino acid permease
VLRVIVALIGAALAALLKDLMAYVLAFVGAAGGTPLLFIIPPFCYIQLKGRENMPGYEFGTNVALIVFGILMTIASLVLIFVEVFTKY